MNRRERVGGWLLWAVLGPLLFAAGLYWTWCWGWWGQESLLFIWLLQCQCPRASEEARYPERVDVIISACVRPSGGSVSPSGRYMLVGQYRPEWAMYLLDLQSGREQRTDLSGGAFFLSEDLALEFQLDRSYVLIDLKDGSRLPLNRLEDVPGAVTPDGTIGSEALARFREAERVLVASSVLVALAPNYKQHADRNFTLKMAGDATEEELMRALGDKDIAFQKTDGDCDTFDCVSRNGLFSAGGGGIYTVADNRLIVPTVGSIRRSFYRMAWIYDDSGAILRSSPPWLIDIGVGGWIEVPQPILKLKVPAEYLSPEAQAREEARQAQEQAAKTQATTVFWAVAGLGGAVTGLSVVRQFRRRKSAGSDG